MGNAKRTDGGDQPRRRHRRHSGFLPHPTSRAAARTPSPELEDDRDAKRVLEELRTHQLELELQNEELRRTQADLLAARDEFAALYDGAPVGYVTTNHGGLVRRANLRFAELLGKDRDSLLGRLLSDSIFSEDQDTYYLHRQAMAGLRGRRSCELRMVKPGGETRWVTLDSVNADEAHGEASIRSAVCDITERKQAEAERERLHDVLVQAQKMEAIGTLAGGIAHDINNILAVIMALGCRLEVSLSEDHPNRQDVRDIVSAVLRGSKLTQDLLDYAHKGTHQLESTCLNDVVERLLAVLKRTVPKHIEIQAELDQELCFVDGDPDKLTQALMNVCLNSVDAIADRGTITITTGSVSQADDILAGFPELEAGSFASVQVADNGCGMDAETVRRACEPFFTTKDVGRGTGLGLSMVYGVVREVGGALRVTSEPHRGTVVLMLLPSRSAGNRLRSQHPGPVGMRGLGRTIMVVDDEALVRSAFQRVLRDIGYGVVVAEGGRAALEAYEANPGAIDAVLLDLSMPEMDGAECYTRLKALNPDVRVVFCTGRARGEAAARLFAGRDVSMVTKPCRPEDLAAALAQALDGDPAIGRAG